MNALSELTAAERDRILAKTARFNPPPPVLADGRRELIGLTREEITASLAEIGEPAFRTKQIWHWVYHQGVTDFTRMSSIAKPLQAKLAEHFIIGRPEAAMVQTSSDETRKFLFRFRDGQEAETVYIPDPVADRGAVCISSQVGCTLSCKFCHTGTQTLVRNLGAAEIVGQFMAARDSYGEWPSPRGETPRLLSTIVLMGMGEPLYNYDNVARAMRIAMDGEGIGLSRRRITLSTSGVVPMMDRCGDELAVNLAISLHAVTDELRDDIVPLNRKYPIKELIAACRRYPAASNARRITFEYVMLKGVNDSTAEAHELVRLIAGIPAKVNLIPFNPWPGSKYETSTPAAIDAFAKIVMDAGFSSPVRTPRGRDILAACGQLRTESAKAGRQS
ncbi:MAG: 23S rRNA (adenine(2503)-C(2))-methyltransferase RlmN [Acetobacteraceae bacterium]|nr:23S rRNA (adenine(2503)-C(2))-methyltransferase RlmN [Acetobacteraceae bacterium]